MIYPVYYGALYRYREKAGTSFHDVFPSLYEQDSVAPVLNEIADFIDMLYPTQKGNRDSY